MISAVGLAPLFLAAFGGADPTFLPNTAAAGLTLAVAFPFQTLPALAAMLI